MAYIFLVAAFTLNAAANILLKIGANKVKLPSGASLSMIFSQYSLVLFGVVLFAINLLCYYMALKSIPLSIAYPSMVVMSFLVINTYAFFFLHEEISAPQVVGYALIVFGLIVIFFFAKRI